MTIATLEHVNVTVSDSKKTAAFLCDIFNWKVRWHGPSMSGGTTYHVGNDKSYIAVYMSKDAVDGPVNGSKVLNGLNHIAILVDDISAVEGRVRKQGFTPHHHGDYEPGYRFYFNDDDGVEYEVVSYVSGFTRVLSEIAQAGIARR